MARAGVASASAHPDSIKGLAQSIANPAYRRLLNAEPLLRRADRMGTTTTQMEMVVQRATLSVAVTVATLKHDGQGLGYVLVFEDLSELLKAQKQAAWREVARRAFKPAVEACRIVPRR